MALTINATPGDASANAYITEAEFDAYCEAHVAGAPSAASDAEKKKAAIIQATRQLDAYVVWKGASTDTAQALAWPRVGLWLTDSTLTDWPTGKAIGIHEIPAGLKNACAEQARLLLVGGDRAAELEQQTQGLKRMNVAGAVDIEFATGGGVLPRQVIAPSAWAFVQSWGAIRQPERGGAVALARA